MRRERLSGSRASSLLGSLAFLTLGLVLRFVVFAVASANDVERDERFLPRILDALGENEAESLLHVLGYLGQISAISFGQHDRFDVCPLRSHDFFLDAADG